MSGKFLDFLHNYIVSEVLAVHRLSERMFSTRYLYLALGSSYSSGLYRRMLYNYHLNISFTVRSAYVLQIIKIFS